MPLTRFTAALRKYGHHLLGCKIPPFADANSKYWAKECTCGFTAALEESQSKSNPAAALGRKGGQAKSDAKTAAVRENGKKGGRPRKPKD
jgi:hypothetical protein